MGISPLLSLAGTALAPLARDVVEKVSDGLSFQNLLGGHESPADRDAASTSEAPAPSFAASPDAAQFDAIRRQPLQALEDFVDRLRQRLEAAGIDLSAAIPLKVGLGGDIQVDGDHPDRAAIEELLAADAQLNSTFRQLASALANDPVGASGQALADEFRLSIDALQFKLAFQ